VERTQRSANSLSRVKVYKIEDTSKVQDHIGHKVTITGELKGDTVQVERVKM
jgi:hypothetical protein